MNTSKLKEKITENKLTMGEMAKEIGVDRSTFYRKLGNIEEFSVRQAFLIGKKLNLSSNELVDIFFNPQVA